MASYPLIEAVALAFGRCLLTLIEYLVACRLSSRCAIQLMAKFADLIISNLAHSVDQTQRLVLRKAVPRTERQVFAEQILLRGNTILHWNDYLSYVLEFRYVFGPLHL